MRERLMVTLVAMTVGMIAVFGVVRAYSTANLVQDQERESVSESADLVAVAVAARGPDEITPAFLDQLTQEGQTLTYMAEDGTRISTRTAARDEDDISATRPVADTGARVILTQQASVSAGRVSDALWSLVLVGLALAVLAAVIGWLLAQRFAYPFRRLAEDAKRIGEGHFDAPVHRSNMREAAELGDALRSAAGQLDELVRRERNLAVVASHELRTPITALRLSLEDLTLWPETPPAVADELQHSLTQVDRLSGVVTALLESGGDRRKNRGSTVDLATVATDAAKRWSAQAEAAGREITVLPTQDPAMVWAAREAIDAVVDILIENALLHGSGTVTIEIFPDSTHFRFRVHDEGSRVIEPGVLHASPTEAVSGLSDAATRAEALGGFIGVGDHPTTLVALFLPRADRRRRASDAVR
ncbi:HAMP domain-containing protein [Aeromicrobium sp. SMF47]|uniref:histidine kinase n=1 Tax=Aeromicrobium yanjiei TaxID=2662028 RepID=A0A5Q2MFA0_9ACTN|nr:HAMP domain-containing sensor histidine kinase [Aeromicrobium yanjiei]MRJ75209.1 HAMP domain-containing protein [Aeromicrobium yanjiei]QGG40341.1 HAMP domain-containing protein [Aeromicrobium yanjiei]